LAREGLAVLVVEAEFAGSGTTSAGMGHLSVLDDNEAEFDLCSTSLELWRELASEMPPECEDDAVGCLWVAADAEELAYVPRKVERYRSRGVAAEELSAEDLPRVEPRLRPGLAGGLLVPGDRVLYQPAVARWLLERAVEDGGAMRRARAAAIDGGSVTLAGGERLEADVVINAAGPWAADLTPGLPVEPRKGHLVITDRVPGFCRHQLIELGYVKYAHEFSPESVAFNVQPRKTGQLLVGSSRQFVGWDPGIDRRLVRRMLGRAVEYMPDLAGVPALRTWVGFRPASPDKLPYIGRWGNDGPWLAAGHEGLGITAATGTARLLADLILGRPPALDPAPFDPNRARRTA
jgi:glycine/D-amino acid oxidase-like deaminating enzyme